MILADRLFLNKSINDISFTPKITLDTVLIAWPTLNTYGVTSKLYKYQIYFSGLSYIIATRLIVVMECPCSGCIFNTGDVADTLVATLPQIHASGPHSDDKFIFLFV